MGDRLDFWNYPAWLGDSRDNPRDPAFEPFWMRPAYSEPMSHGYLIDISQMHAVATTEAYIPNYDCIIRWTNADGETEEVYATRGQRTYRPEGMSEYTIETDSDMRFFMLQEV